MVDFKEKLKDVPTNPGVYLMLNDDGEIIYVGKAKNLKNRLRSYFLNTNKQIKVQAMLNHVCDFRYIICSSEIDALLTENNLIKKHTPKYNILLKDDKSYPFLRINLKDKYPKIELVRRLKDDGAKYFGPYMQSVNIKDIFDLIHTSFNVRDCNRDLSSPSRPCLNMHLGKCLAPCTGNVSEEEYKNEILKVVEFLKGNDKEIEKILREKMMYFSSIENYEVALTYKNKLEVLNKLVRKQVSSLPQDYNFDVFAFETNGVISAINMLNVRGGKLVGGENFTVDCFDDDLASYIYQFYLQNAPLCDEIITDGIEDMDLLEKAINDINGNKVKVFMPKQGVKKQLLDTAHKNAYDAMVKYGTKEDRTKLRTEGAVKALQEVLNLKSLPNRIECFDISHISGTDKVASMVVFENGVPKKSHYRKFKIKTVEGNNDFACMKEVLTRRLLKLNDEDESFSTRPDLLLIDGGKGQLKYALEAQAETGTQDIEICSLAERDEIVFMGNNPKQEIIIRHDNISLQLLQRVRDEAHRFAITFHRNLRSKHLSETQLLSIDGVGKKTALKLLNAFGSVEEIKHKSVEEISSINGISKAFAEQLLSKLK